MASLIQLNRLFSFDDLIAQYGGPRSLWEKLRPHLPVFCTQVGLPVYLESDVDEFLKAVRDGLQLNSARSTVPEFGSLGDRTEEEPDFVTVAETQRRFLAGTRSRRWWYRLIETGRIAHHRIGDSILLRTKDIEDFIAKSRQELPEEREIEPAQPPAIPLPVPPPVKPRPRSKPEEDPLRFQFFPRR
ncbi:MAG: DNA-binding protein [Gemmataceae bacterium]|nr:DNA-binding protein [Gemmataceae bacterium]